MKTTRVEIVKQLLCDCPRSSLEAHQAIVDVILAGESWETLRDLDEMDQYPETSHWLESQFKQLID